MRRKLRALRPGGSQVATCDVHLPLAMDRVTAQGDGETHLLVHRVTDNATPCAYWHGNAERGQARWVLAPQAVLA